MIHNVLNFHGFGYPDKHTTATGKCNEQLELWRSQSCETTTSYAKQTKIHTFPSRQS